MQLCSKPLATLFLLIILTIPLFGLAGDPMSDEVTTATILEMLEAGGYSYFYVEDSDSTYWIAVRELPAFVGAQISFVGQMWMPDFKSNTLSMTFPNILFSGDAVVKKSADQISREFAQIASKRLPGTLDIVDLFQDRDTYKDSTVMVFGEAVKVMHKVMSKTWVHLYDNSGSPDSATVVITTMDNTIKMGSILTAQGTLAVDKDFGYGYFYPMIIEDAVFIK